MNHDEQILKWTIQTQRQNCFNSCDKLVKTRVVALTR